MIRASPATKSEVSVLRLNEYLSNNRGATFFYRFNEIQKRTTNEGLSKC
jgi:hypothetical protein